MQPPPLLVHIFKKFETFGFFVGDVISRVGFGILAQVTRLRCQRQEPIFWLKFLMETRL